MARVKNVSVPQKTLTKLQKESKELADCKEEVLTLTDDKEKLQKVIDDKDHEISGLLTEVQDAEHARDVAIEDKNDLQEKFDAIMKALRDSGKSASFEQKKDVKDKIQPWIKEWGFRTHKFAIKDEALVKFTGGIYEALKISFGWEEEATKLPKKEFVRIYKSYVAAQLSLRRQYVQTQLQKACIGTHYKLFVSQMFCLN